MISSFDASSILAGVELWDPLILPEEITLQNDDNPWGKSFCSLPLSSKKSGKEAGDGPEYIVEKAIPWFLFKSSRSKIIT